MKYIYSNNNRDTAIAELFSREITIPDNLGAVLRVYKHGNYLHMHCEHGVHIHKFIKRNPYAMKAKGLLAKAINSRP